MKGLVFTEFLEMVEERHGLAAVDALLQAAALPSGGAYTAVGTYPHEELLALAATFSEQTATELPELMHGFGAHCFERFSAAHAQFFEGVESSFDLLKSIEHHIHVEVRKLYPDAELPQLEYEEPEPGALVLRYRSSRPMADFCAGLVHSCVAHFSDDAEIARSEVSDDRRSAAFFLVRRNGL